MNLAGLNFDNMPKFSIPLRFFISASIFALMACLFFLVPSIWQSRWQPSFIAMTHVFTLGFFVMVMFGAITQVLPVLTGKGIDRVDKRAPRIHLLLVLGVMIFPLNFIIQDSFVVILGLAPLLMALLILLRSLLYLFKATRIKNDTVRSIRLAVIGLMVAIMTGLWQLFSYQIPALTPLDMGKTMTNLHLMWGLLGWVSALIMAVSFQVVPMFHVTPEFPKWLRQYWPSGLFFLMILVSFSAFFQWSLGLISGLCGIVLALGVYGVVGSSLLRRRKRQVSDVTVNFWRLAFTCLLLAIITWIGSFILPLAVKAPLQLLALLLFVFGYLMAVALGMLIKIVPFLAYLNLQQSALNCLQAMTSVPSMNEIQSKRIGQGIFYCYCIGLLFILLVPWFSHATYGLAFTLTLVFCQLIYLQFNTWLNYKQHDEKITALILEHGKFSF